MTWGPSWALPNIDLDESVSSETFALVSPADPRVHNAAREAANRSETLVLLNRIRANIEAAFAGAPSYGNNADLVAALDRRGGIPDSARTIGAGNTAEIRHPFGGLVTVTGGPGGITNRFRIQFEAGTPGINAE